jgi:hypothetical protein
MRVMKIKETKLVCTVAANVPKSLSDVSILQLWMQDLENGIVSERNAHRFCEIENIS